MITVRDRSTIANISELREKKKSDQILKNLKDHKVILEKHNNPVAVMLDYNHYEQLERLLDLAEDFILGALSKERDISTKKEDFIDIENW